MSDFNEKFWLNKVYQISHGGDLDSDKYEILNYFRELVDQGEKERDDWLSTHEKIRVRQDQVHRTEWELKTRKEEISELERQVNLREEALS